MITPLRSNPPLVAILGLTSHRLKVGRVIQGAVALGPLTIADAILPEMKCRTTLYAIQIDK